MLTLQLEKGAKEKEYLDSVLDASPGRTGEPGSGGRSARSSVETGYLRRGKTAAKRQKG